MRIGIVTVWNDWISSNYGSLFQCFALQQFLRRRGHSPYLVSRGAWGDLNRTRREDWFTEHGYTGRFASLLMYWKYKRLKQKTSARFKETMDFIQSHIESCAPYYTNEELFRNPPDADAFLVGSDQVWTEEHAAAFLAFTKTSLRLAYAVSGRIARPSEKWISLAKEHLPLFTAVSCREQEGCDTCAELGISAELVVDPVLLLSRLQYEELLSHKKSYMQDFILVYVLNINSLDEINMKAVDNYAKKNHLRIVVVAAQGAERQFHGYQLEYPSPTRFLRLIKDASAVVTNSYHGVLFSIIFEKSFAVLIQSGEYVHENVRHINFLQNIKEERRIFSINKYLSDILSLPTVELNKVITPWVERSKDFLNKYIPLITTL